MCVNSECESAQARDHQGVCECVWERASECVYDTVEFQELMRRSGNKCLCVWVWASRAFWVHCSCNWILSWCTMCSMSFSSSSSYSCDFPSLCSRLIFSLARSFFLSLSFHSLASSFVLSIAYTLVHAAPVLRFTVCRFNCYFIHIYSDQP